MTDFQLWICCGTVEEVQALKYTPSGLAILDFRVLSTHTSEWEDKKREESCSAPCVLFGKRAEAMKGLLPGARVLVQGRWREQKWEGKDGKPRSRHIVAVNEITLLTGGANPSTTLTGDPEFDKDAPF